MSPRGKPTKGNVKGSRLLVVAGDRLADMEVLFQKRRFNAAVYIGGYVVECVLKWAITRTMAAKKLPAEFEHHNLDLLFAKAFPLNPQIAFLQSHNAFAEISDEWDPSLRYESAPVSKSHAENFCGMVRLVYDEIREHFL